jgi:hypothetical protein
MVRLSEVTVDVGPKGSPSADDLKATLSFEAEFSDDEVELNLAYHVWGILYEIDGGRDEYIIWPNGGGIRIQRASDGDRDDFITFFRGGTTRPEEGRRQSFELTEGIGDYLGLGAEGYIVGRTDANVIDEYGSQSEFRAIAVMVPSVSMGATFSNRYDVTLEEEPY